MWGRSTSAVPSSPCKYSDRREYDGGSPRKDRRDVEGPALRRLLSVVQTLPTSAPRVQCTIPHHSRPRSGDWTRTMANDIEECVGQAKSGDFVRKTAGGGEYGSSTRTDTHVSCHRIFVLSSRNSASSTNLRYSGPALPRLVHTSSSTASLLIPRC